MKWIDIPALTIYSSEELTLQPDTFRHGNVKALLKMNL